MTAHPISPIIVLAFDFGTRRTGVAVGNTLTRSAQPLTTLDADTDDVRLAAIAELVSEWRPQSLVVGIPVHADGTPHKMTARAERFALDLESRFALPVARADERHTTRLAQAALNASRAGRGGRAQRDALAAQLILQGWLDEHA